MHPDFEPVQKKKRALYILVIVVIVGFVAFELFLKSSFGLEGMPFEKPAFHHYYEYVDSSFDCGWWE